MNTNNNILLNLFLYLRSNANYILTISLLSAYFIADCSRVDGIITSRQNNYVNRRASLRAYTRSYPTQCRGYPCYTPGKCLARQCDVILLLYWFTLIFLTQKTEWDFDPEVGKQRRIRYEQENGRFGEIAIAKLGMDTNPIVHGKGTYMD